MKGRERIGTRAELWGGRKGNGDETFDYGQRRVSVRRYKDNSRYERAEGTNLELEYHAFPPVVLFC